MKTLSNFRKQLRIDLNNEQMKRYALEQINLREDQETGKIELFLKKKYPGIIKNNKAWTEQKIRYKDINVKDPTHVIKYTIQISPSGLFSRREYENEEDKKRYNKVYMFRHILNQLFGMSYEEASTVSFTKSELLHLIDRINEEKQNTLYSIVYKVKYDESYQGEKILDGMHIAVSYNTKQIECIENTGISVRLDDDKLIIISGEKKECIDNNQYTLENKSNCFICNGAPRHDYYALEGYSINAIRKILEYNKKEEKEHE